MAQVKGLIQERKMVARREKECVVRRRDVRRRVGVEQCQM